MAKVKNRRDNHNTKRPSSRAAYGESSGSRQLRSEKRTTPQKRDFDYRQESKDFEQLNPNILVGRNPVTEALKNGREIDKLMVSSSEGSM